jgi:hypothetical protein
VFWFALVLSEYNDHSAADEEFGLAFAASAAVAVGASALAKALANRRIDTPAPAAMWVSGYVSAAVFLVLYLWWATNHMVAE